MIVYSDMFVNYESELNIMKYGNLKCCENCLEHRFGGCLYDMEVEAEDLGCKLEDIVTNERCDYALYYDEDEGRY